jgi:transketolase
MRPALRLAALMKAPAVFLFTHDGIGVGEDGPTHQPVEHLMSLRLIPGLLVLRPADAWETLYAWEAAVRTRRPACLALSRQKLPLLTQFRNRAAEGVKRGGYILREAVETPDVELIATGSEVSLALEAADLLDKKGIAARVVSMPSFELFREQPAAYREKVLSPGTPKLAVEAGRTAGWKDLAGTETSALGVETFGKSAPAGQVYADAGLTAQKVAGEAASLAKGRGR